MSREEWRSALVGAITCAFVGPAIGLLVVEARIFRRPSSIREIAGFIIVFSKVFPKAWIVALVAFGPAALFLGAIGAVLLRKLVRKSRSMKIAMIQAATLGLGFGGSVPVVSIPAIEAVLPPQTPQRDYGLKADILGYLPLGAISGIVCALLVLWLLHLLNLWPRRNNPPTNV